MYNIMKRWFEYIFLRIKLSIRTQFKLFARVEDITKLLNILKAINNTKINILFVIQ